MTAAFVIAFVLIGASLIWNQVNENAIIDLRHEIAYNKILPQVEEYAKLKGTGLIERYKDTIEFGCIFNGTAEVVLISKLPRHLERFKEVLERNCPTKCTAKAKKRK